MGENHKHGSQTTYTLREIKKVLEFNTSGYGRKSQAWITAIYTLREIKKVLEFNTSEYGRKSQSWITDY